jgi:ribonuclease T1
MWIHLLRRATNHPVVRCTYFVLSALSSSTGLEESPAYAERQPGAEISASVQRLSGPSSESQQTIERAAPDKAYALLEALKRRNGEPLPGYAGGKTFQNRERRLPGGRYKEYDVNRRQPGRSRDAERLVIEQGTGKAYYTDDHYRTFLPLN